MRPDILHPLFAEVETMPGVGPQVAKLLKRLNVTRVVDLLYHLPTGVIERVRAPAASGSLLGCNVILDLVPFQTREPRSGRGPMRVFASDEDGNTISLALVKPRSLGDLAKAGDNLFMPLAPTVPVDPAERRVHSHYLEHSAANPILEMTQLIEASRAYEANIRMIQNHDQTLGSLIGRLLKA